MVVGQISLEGEKSHLIDLLLKPLPIIHGNSIVVQVNGHPRPSDESAWTRPRPKTRASPSKYFGKEASQFTTSLLKANWPRLVISTFSIASSHLARCRVTAKR